MIRTRWYKVFHDLWGNKVRTLLVVASIFIGVLGIGAIVSLYVMLDQDLQYSYELLDAHHAEISSEPFDPDLVHSIRRLPGVRDAEGQRVTNVQVRTGPDEWTPMTLTARADLNEMRMTRLQPDRGDWPPADRQIWIERGSVAVVHADVGDVLDAGGLAGGHVGQPLGSHSFPVGDVPNYVVERPRAADGQ